MCHEPETSEISLRTIFFTLEHGIADNVQKNALLHHDGKCGRYGVSGFQKTTKVMFSAEGMGSNRRSK